MNELHFEGFIRSTDDGVKFFDDYELLAEKIGGGLESSISSKHEEYPYETQTSIYVPNVSFRFYVSDEKCSLEEAMKGFLQSLFGSLDIYTTWYGYSEYTIEGYDVENFTVGEHNLEEILRSYDGKYLHILVEVK